MTRPMDSLADRFEASLRFFASFGTGTVVRRGHFRHCLQCSDTELTGAAAELVVRGVPVMIGPRNGYCLALREARNEQD